MKREKILITSALIYANGPLHFGHLAGAYLPADCYARFERLRGSDVVFISGSDEYGMAVTLSAELAGKTPREHVDEFHRHNQDLFRQMNIAFDHFSRTTWEGHKALVQEFFLDLLENGHIEEQVTQQLYSPTEERFLADRYVVGECPKCHYREARGDECPKCGATYEATELLEPRSTLGKCPLVLKDTKNWFLRSDHFKEELSAWIKKKNWKPNVINFVLPYIQDLRSRAITRDLSWGVPVPLPNSEGKVLYVWFDAPIGYLSATQEWAKLRGEPHRWEDYWCDPQTKLIQFIGKDNIVFHAVLFPSMIMGQKNRSYKCVDILCANEFLQLEGKQFSKSSGWYIDLQEFLVRFSPDQLRYALLANAPETHDAEFTWDDFQMRCNVELVGKLGNFVHRTLTFVYTRMEKMVPSVYELEEIDQEFIAALERLTQEAYQHYQRTQFRKVTTILMHLAALANGYFDKKQPWKLIKDKQTLPQLETTMALCMEAMKILALIAFPIMPNAADKLWKLIGNTTDLESANWEHVISTPLPAGQSILEPVVLFTKIDDELILREKEKLYAHAPDKVYKAVASEISIDHFGAVDLRIGTILTVEKIPKSKRLLHMQVDLGFEKRCIVSGIGEHYSDERRLVGKKVAIVANLKPAKIMGYLSQGMILTAGEGGCLELLTVDDCIPSGTKVC